MIVIDTRDVALLDSSQNLASPLNSISPLFRDGDIVVSILLHQQLDSTPGFSTLDLIAPTSWPQNQEACFIEWPSLVAEARPGSSENSFVYLVKPFGLPTELLVPESAIFPQSYWTAPAPPPAFQIYLTSMRGALLAAYEKATESLLELLSVPDGPVNDRSYRLGPEIISIGDGLVLIPNLSTERTESYERQDTVADWEVLLLEVEDLDLSVARPWVGGTLYRIAASGKTPELMAERETVYLDDSIIVGRYYRSLDLARVRIRRI